MRTHRASVRARPGRRPFPGGNHRALDAACGSSDSPRGLDHSGKGLWGVAATGPSRLDRGRRRHPFTCKLRAEHPPRLARQIAAPRRRADGSPYLSRAPRVEHRCAEQRPPLIRRSAGATEACAPHHTHRRVECSEQAPLREGQGAAAERPERGRAESCQHDNAASAEGMILRQIGKRRPILPRPPVEVSSPPTPDKPYPSTVFWRRTMPRGCHHSPSPSLARSLR